MLHLQRAVVFGVAVFFMLCACSSNSNGLVPQSAHQGVALSVSIKWPSKNASPQRVKRDFISPSAQSVTLALNGAIVATMNAPGAGGTTAVTVNYMPGETLTMKTFDGTNGSGTLLGQVDAQPNVQPGRVNSVSMVVVGIAKSVSMTLSAVQQTALYTGDATSGYTILGSNGLVFDTTLKDADGNIILDPPPFELQGNTTIAASYDQTSHSNVAFYGMSAATAYENVALVFKNPDGSTLTAPSVKLRATGLVGVISSGTNTISEFQTDGTPVALPAGSFPGLQRPTAITYDTCLHLWVVADVALTHFCFLEQMARSIRTQSARSPILATQSQLIIMR